MMKTMVYGADGAELTELLTRARGLGCQAPEVAWMGSEPEPELISELARFGAARILVVNDPTLADRTTDVMAAALSGLMEVDEPILLLMGSDLRGRELAPRTAHTVGAGCVVDALSLKLEDGQAVTERYALGGNTLARERITTAKQVVAVNLRSVEPEPAEVQGAVTMDKVALTLEPSRVKVVETRSKPHESVNLEDADTLVCVGRGIEKEGDLELINQLATTLGGEVGCTRPLSHDLHWLSEERMVGISGKKCSPKLNIAIGLSGEIQHSVGIMGARIIVAINKDKAAPIFKLADYGVVGDLYQILPALVKELQQG